MELGDKAYCEYCDREGIIGHFADDDMIDMVDSDKLIVAEFCSDTVACWDCYVDNHCSVTDL